MKFLSLKYKLFFFSLALSALLTSVVSIFEINYDISAHRRELRKELIRFEKNYHSYLSSKVWAMEYDALGVFVEGELGERLINLIEIRDIKGRIIAGASDRVIKTYIGKYFNLSYFHNNAKIKIGEVNIRGSVPGFFEILKTRWMDIFLINGFLVALIFLFSYLLFYRSVIARLNAIIEYTDQDLLEEKTGLISSPPWAFRPDEITLLTNSLNDRAMRIRDEFSRRLEAESKLKEKNDQLIGEIEERLEIEAALKSSQNTFLSVLDGIDATIYVSDLKTHEILFMNRYMIDSFGRDMVGEKCYEVFRNVKDPCSHCTNDRIVDENGNPSGLIVWQGKNPVTGKWYINYDRAIEWKDGRLVKLQIATDITEFKQMEEELRQVHKMESIGTLAGGVAHDFNNILSIIIGNTELALAKLSPDSPPGKNLEKIRAASIRARDVVSQLLRFSRKAEVIRKPIDILPVIRESVKLIRSSIPSSIEILETLPDSCPPLLADATQIHQVVINLCTNAAHAMADEKGIINISVSKIEGGKIDTDDNDLKKIQVDPSLEKSIRHMIQGRYLALSVRDDGSGMEPGIREKIFDPYFTTKGVGKGTGMGLALVHGIVKSHNGHVFVDSQVGQGTTFHLLFPLIYGDYVQKPSLTREIRPKGTERILLVDDEPAIVEVIKSGLTGLGYQVTGETDPLEALKVFRSDPGQYDLILSDMTMPGMSGVDLAEKVRVERRDIPIIICTGHSSLLDKQKAEEIGISAFLMKPLSMADMAKTVRTVLV